MCCTSTQCKGPRRVQNLTQYSSTSRHTSAVAARVQLIAQQQLPLLLTTTLTRLPWCLLNVTVAQQAVVSCCQLSCCCVSLLIPAVCVCSCQGCVQRLIQVLYCSWCPAFGVGVHGNCAELHVLSRYRQVPEYRLAQTRQPSDALAVVSEVIKLGIRCWLHLVPVLGFLSSSAQGRWRQVAR